MPYKDREKRLAQAKIYSSRYYNKNKGAVISRHSRNKRKLIVWYCEYKKTLSCKFCGEDASVCLDFHHRDPKQKRYSVSLMPAQGRSKSLMLKEMAKCDVVCSNCHRKLHAGLI